ncbi:MAG: winged helix-turn-helix transcriptional regulator [Candidatus Helarchaeota archaeon]
MLKKFKKKIGEEIDRIKEDLEPKELLIKRYLEERGIANIELMASDLGLLTSVAKITLENMVENEKIKGMFIYDNKEFVLLQGIENDILATSEDAFKFNFKEIMEKYSLSLTNIRRVIINLISEGRIRGFFDLPDTYIFYNISEDEEKQLIDEINKQKLNLIHFSEFVKDIISTHDDVDLSALIEVAEKPEEQTSEEDFAALAEEVIKEANEKKFARSILELFLITNKIKGNFTRDYDYFVSDEIVLKELLNFIKFTREISFEDVEEELAIISPELIKSYIEILERNHGLEGYFTEDDSYVLKDVIDETILNTLQACDDLNITELQQQLKLNKDTLIQIMKELAEKDKIDGCFNATKDKFYKFSKIKNEMFNRLLEAKEIEIEELNSALNLAENDLLQNVERIVSMYRKQLRGVLTSDGKTFIKEETLDFRLMDFLNSRDQTSLKDLEQQVRLDVETLKGFIQHLLELGLISGKIEKDIYFKS